MITRLINFVKRLLGRSAPVFQITGVARVQAVLAEFEQKQTELTEAVVEIQNEITHDLSMIELYNKYVEQKKAVVSQAENAVEYLSKLTGKN